MPPILLYWPATLEADAGDMTVEVEPSGQLFVTLLPCDRQQSGKMAFVS
jgi:hypothetical protein